MDTALLSNYCDFCLKHSLPENTFDTSLKLIISSLRNVDNERIYQSVFRERDSWFEWDRVHEKENALGLCAYWVRFLDTMSIAVPSIDKLKDTTLQTLASAALTTKLPLRHASNKHVVAKYVNCVYESDACLGRETISQSSSPGDTDAQLLREFWDDFVKLIVVMNLKGTTSLRGAYDFLSHDRHFDTSVVTDIHQRCLEYTSLIVDQHISSHAWSEVFVFILSDLLTPKNNNFMDDVSSYLSLHEKQKDTFRVKISEREGMHRPRLRLLLENLKHALVLEEHTFSHWLGRMRFGTTANMVEKRRVYFLCCQVDQPMWEDILPKLRNITVENYRQNAVSTPDVLALTEAIRTLRFASPFDRLCDFRRVALRSLNPSTLNGIPMQKIFLLYVCAYQHEQIWRRCFVSIMNVMFPILQIDIERFVKENAFVVDEVKKTILHGLYV